MIGETKKNMNNSRKGGSIPKPASAGPIDANAIYSLPDFKARARWSNHALRTAKRRGLRVFVEGGTGFVRGQDFHDYLAKIADELGTE
jgi:hypothetical protein